jgi:hypothetical protein
MTTHGGVVIAIAAAKLFELHQDKWRIDQAALAALFAIAGITDADAWFHDAIADRLRDIGRAFRDTSAVRMIAPNGCLAREAHSLAV